MKRCDAIFKSGVRAEKPDEELFFISKSKLNLNESGDGVEAPVEVVKKKKLTLQEKLDNMHCYKHLKPDVHSAPAHVVDKKIVADPESKRQRILRERATNAKKAAELSARIESGVDNSSQAKRVKPTSGDLEFTLSTDFNKNLWTCKCFAYV